MKELIKFKSVDEFKTFAEKYNEKHTMLLKEYQDLLKLVENLKSGFVIQIKGNRYFFGSFADEIYTAEGFTIISSEEAYEKYFPFKAPKQTKYLFES